ncbi:MAG: hypothetical protein ACK5NG_01635 [Chthoniobacterales bacterium]
MHAAGVGSDVAEYDSKGGAFASTVVAEEAKNRRDCIIFCKRSITGAKSSFTSAEESV